MDDATTVITSQLYYPGTRNIKPAAYLKFSSG